MRTSSIDARVMEAIYLREMKSGNRREKERDIDDGSPSNRTQNILEFGAFGRERRAVELVLPLVVNERCVLIPRRAAWML